MANHYIALAYQWPCCLLPLGSRCHLVSQFWLTNCPKSLIIIVSVKKVRVHDMWILPYHRIQINNGKCKYSKRLYIDAKTPKSKRSQSVYSVDVKIR